MNKKGYELNLLGQAIVFIVLFFIGGIIGITSLPMFPGRFYAAGLVFAACGIGVGKVIVHFGGRR